MKFFEIFQLPITDPVLVFLLIFLVIFLAPRILKRIRIPGIVGFILAGVLLGPHGFRIISPVNGINMFSSFGLLYIMFLVGLELDLVDFRKNQSRSTVFGALTFFIPLILGFLVTYYVLKLSLLASLLLSSMFSTHTLVSYPIASKLGITKNRVISTVIGGTIITDTAVLLLLAIIVSVFKGNMDLMFWVSLISMLIAFVAIMLWVVPLVSRWFFKNLEGDGSAQYLYVITVVFGAAFLSEIAGIEPMIGAFFAGLALNKLIPPSSVLMNRTVFIGNTLFIPFFLIGVGMILDLSVLLNGYNALIIAGILVVTAEITKYIAAFITQKIYGFTVVERHVLFGLSSSHAAATIALILVGFNLGILNIDVLNGTIIVILISCLISSFITENAGRKLAVVESKKLTEEDTSIQRIMVPVANPSTMEKLISFAMLIKDKASDEPIFPLNVVLGSVETEEARQEILQKKQLIEQIANQTITADQSIRLVTRIDLNVANGINRAIKELMITNIVLGWNGQTTTAQSIFGGILENILPKNNQMMFVVKILHQFGYYKRLVLIVPPNAEFEPGYKKWLKQVLRISKELSAKFLLFANSKTLTQLKLDMDVSKAVSLNFVEFNDYENLSTLKDHLSHTDLMIWISARESTISYHNYLANLPKFLSKNFEKSSFIIIYPEQHFVLHQKMTLRIDGLTKSPIKENIDRITKISKNVKNAIKRKPKK
ncbi:MAG: cation:proton antiporter [Bacteroidota bacterium]